MSKIDALKKLASSFKNPEDAKIFLDKLTGGVEEIKTLEGITPAEFEELDFAKRSYGADANRRKLPVTPENIEALTRTIPTEIPKKSVQDLELDALEKDSILAGVNPSKLKAAGIGGAVAAGTLFTPQQSEAAPVSRFNTLLKGLDEAAPQIKGTLKDWGEELNTLRANPAGNEKRMQQLSDNIKSTVEANAKRGTTKAGNVLTEGVQPSMSVQDSLNKDYSKKQTLLPRDAQVLAKEQRVAAMAAGPTDWYNSDGSMKDPISELNKGADLRGKQFADTFLSDKDQETKDFAQRAVRNIINPSNLIGGVGLADAAMGAVDTLIPDGTLDKGIKRFKGLLDK